MKLNFTKTIPILVLVAGLFISHDTQAQDGIYTIFEAFPNVLAPTAVAVDASGNVYIAEEYNHIRKVSVANDSITIVAGNGYGTFSGDGGPADSAAIYFPHGVAVDDSGNIYIADTYNNRVRKVSAATGIITTIAGHGANGFGDGGYSGDEGPGDFAELNAPFGVAVDNFGNVYIADTYNNRVRKVSAATGIITTFAGNGNYGYYGDGGPANYAVLLFPSGVAVDDSGNVYIADTYNNCIREVNVATNIINTIAGGAGDGVGAAGYSGDGGPAINALLNMPTGLALDALGNIFIADWQNSRIRKINAATGIITTVAGGGENGVERGGPADSVLIDDPVSVAVDSSFNLYIVSQVVGKVTHPASVSAGVSQIVCNGSNIILNPVATGGVPPYTYAWQSNGNPLSCQTCQNPSVNLTQNSTYTVTVTDALQYTATATVSYQLSSTVNNMQVSFTNTGIKCTNEIDTTAAAVTGGSSPFTFNWGTGDSTLGTSPQNYNYTQPGQYIVIVTDSNGCQTATFDTVLYKGTAITLVQAIQPGCPGQHNGEIIVSVSGGTPPYNLLWSDSSSSDTLLNVTNETYTLSVTDADSCPAVFDYTLISVPNNSNYYAFLTATNPNCNTTGSIVCAVTGGVPPYSYLWNNGVTNSAIYSFSTNLYAVTVTDSSGCTITGSTSIDSNCYNIISGTVFVDSSGTCIYNGSQPGIPNVILTLSGGSQTLYATTDSGGNYTFDVNADSESYYLFIQVGNESVCGNFTFCSNDSQTVTVNGSGDSSLNNNFGLVPSSSNFDLYLHPGWTTAYPGSEKDYWIYFANNSPVPFTDTATVVFKYDSNLVFISSDIPYTSYNASADSIIWNVYPFNNAGWNYVGKVHFNVPSTLSPNYQLQSQFWIYPFVGDCDTSNNYLHYSEIVIGSHDPNEKDAQPAGNITANDSILIYTIHFQNTGTDSSHFIIVTDTLSPNLNPATVQNLASSYIYSSFTVSGKGILTWTFNPYRLVDSTTNPSGSKGFITFSVKEMRDLPIGATISNTASIYFDYNAPVVTNTVTDTLVICSLSSPDITANSNTICPNDSAAICAPAGFISYNWNDNDITQCTEAKSAGNYFVMVTDNNGCIVESNYINITVLQSPQVSISRNGDTLFAYNATNAQWYLNNNAVNGATQNIYVAQTYGSYTVSTTDSNGCSALSSAIIYTGIFNTIEDDNISIYPNPTNGNWQMDVSNNLIGAQVEILNDNGSLVYKSEIKNTHNVIEASFAGGVYFLRVTFGAGLVVRKLVKL